MKAGTVSNKETIKKLFEEVINNKRRVVIAANWLTRMVELALDKIHRHLPIYL